MTLVGLVAAVAAGLVVGLGGHLLGPARWLPRWLSVAVGVLAAVLGTLAARTVAAPAAGFGPSDIVAPVLFAALGVAVLRARRGPPVR